MGIKNDLELSAFYIVGSAKYPGKKQLIQPSGWNALSHPQHRAAGARRYIQATPGGGHPEHGRFPGTGQLVAQPEGRMHWRSLCHLGDIPFRQQAPGAHHPVSRQQQSDPQPVHGCRLQAAVRGQVAPTVIEKAPRVVFRDPPPEVLLQCECVAAPTQPPCQQ